jgi:hypothetical protein
LFSLKHQILKDINRIDCLKNSSSFFYNLACRLTEVFNHDQFNLDIHLATFCSNDQMLDLLSRWSIKRLEQIDSSFRLKLIQYHPLIIIHLIKGDLNEMKDNGTKLIGYFEKNNNLFELLAEQETKAMCRLMIEHFNHLDQHQEFSIGFIQSKQKEFFKKAPDEMIQLITILAKATPGLIDIFSKFCDIRYLSRYNTGFLFIFISSFIFRRSLYSIVFCFI